MVPRVNDSTDRIEAVRLLIPRMLFDDHRWRKVPGAEPDHTARNSAQEVQWLIRYRRPCNEATGTYGAQPKHDDASHATDAGHLLPADDGRARTLVRRQPARAAARGHGAQGWRVVDARLRHLDLVVGVFLLVLPPRRGALLLLVLVLPLRGEDRLLVSGACCWKIGAFERCGSGYE